MKSQVKRKNLARSRKMVKRKNHPRSSSKARFMVDGISYTSKSLYEFHLECKEAQDKKLIREFSIPVSAKKSRYTTYKPVLDGHEFDSLMEARFYIHLQELKKSGQIEAFEMQVPYELQPKFTKNNKVFRPISYVADFVVTYKDRVCVIDTKGKETVEFKIKKKLFEYKFPELELSILQYYPKTGQWLELDTIRKLIRKEKNAAAGK